MAFSPIRPPFKWTPPTWFMHDMEKHGFYHWTHHSSSSNTRHHDHRGGGGGGNHTHSSTYHRQTSLYSPCDTRQSFKHNSATYIWNEKEPINNRGDSLYLEITCACLIGNKVLVVGNTDVRFDFTLMASPRAPRPRALAGHVIVPWARQQRGVAVRHGSAGSSLSPDLRRQERNATLV